MIVLLPREKVRWEFGNITHVLFARREYLQSLYAEKIFWEIILPTLGMEYDPKRDRVFVLEESPVRYNEVFQKILDIRKEIDRINTLILPIRAEMHFRHQRQHTTD